MGRRLGLFICSFLVSISSFSQVEGPCAQSLQRANSAFEIGHFYAISGILKNCLDNGFSREQKIQAYTLLTRTYLFLDKLDSADYAFLQVLELDPEFKVDEENDPIDIVYLSRNFTTSPILSLKIEAGTNFSRIDVVHNFGVDNTDQSEEKYRTGWGAQAGIGAELHFSNSVSLELLPRVSLKRFRYFNTLWDGDQQTKTESNLVLDIPLLARFTFPGEQWRPYVFAGGEANLVFISRSKNILENITGDAVTPTEGPTVNNRPSRNFVNRSLVLGGGVMYKFGYNYLHARVSYNAGLNLLNNRDKRYVEDNGLYNDPNLWLYAYADDDFRFNSIMISVGYTKPLYYPRKKSKFTLRDWFQKKTGKEEEEK